MVVSTLIANSVPPSTGGGSNENNIDASIHWSRQSPTNLSNNDQRRTCILDYNSIRESSIQNNDESNCFNYDNDGDQRSISPTAQDASRSSGSEDISASTSHMFAISGSAMMQQCMDYSNSENESSQASPSSFHDHDHDHDDDGSYRTKGSSNGKGKLHKCKSCGFTTANKHESWAHIATHLKPEKILRCPQCPFVTEYKHHLDFHIGNHQGVKPYKCIKCPYECVNKSMLKSHLKSHSNVYQYRCANCAYRTKYCHSLKIHLRKYRHEPGMVLDSEGNPNPNPVIDVYGNRRGPKQKPKKQETPLPSSITPSIQQLNTFQNLHWVNNVFFHPSNNRVPIPSLIPSSMLETTYLSDSMMKNEDTSPQSQHSGGSDKNYLYGFNNNNNNNNQLNLQSLMRDDSDRKSDTEPIKMNDEKYLLSPQPISRNIPPQFENTFHSSPEEPIFNNDCAPLNLSMQNCNGISTPISTPTPPPAPVTKNRRKGIALKLKRNNTSDDESPKIKLENDKIEDLIKKEKKTGEKEEEVEEEPNNELLDKLKSKKSFFYCGFCEITFFNQIMFTMHMGYHGYSDPFTCNRCGQKTDDSIAFYAHMISSAHL